MSTPTVFTVITTKLNAGQNAANTGAGAQNPDGSFNFTGTVLGTAQTVHAGIELATLGKKVGSAIPLTGLLLSAASAGVAAKAISDDWSSGKAVKQSDVAALVGGAVGMGGAVIVLMGASGPIMVTLAAAAVATSVAAGGYQLYAAAKGLTFNAATGQTVEVTLTTAQMAQIDQHLQQTMPLWNQTNTLPELGFVTGTKVQTVGSVFSASASNANDVPAPSGLDTPTRNSAALINTTGAHTTQFNSGGGVDDLWVVEKNAGRYLGTRDQFRADFVASNANVDGKTLGVQQGQNYYVPQRSANGNTVYHYSNGATVMNNAITGEYHMVVPNTDGSGGQTVYSRTADDVGYTVKQVSTNAAGAVVFEHQSYQNTLDTDLNPVSTTSVSGNQTTTRNWFADTVFQTDTFVGPPAPTNTTPSTSSLDFGPVSYNLFDAAQNNNASYKMWQLKQNNGLSSNAYNSFTQQSSNFVVDYSLGGTGSSNWGQLKPPSNFDFFPIGAFYDSQSAAFDNAASIADKTTRAMNANGQALSATQLAALDTNGDGSLSTAETSGTRLWADLNENGALDTNELQSVGSSIKAADYGFYTRGNGNAAGAKLTAAAAPSVGSAGNRPQAPSASAPGSSNTAAGNAPATPTAASLPGAPIYFGVPASNFRTLRDTDNIYDVGNSFIAFTASQVKINNGNRSYMIGTDGADSFDSSTYAQTGYFNNNLLTNFLAGGGNDEMGGSVRYDNLWQVAANAGKYRMTANAI